MMLMIISFFHFSITDVAPKSGSLAGRQVRQVGQTCRSAGLNKCAARKKQDKSIVEMKE